MPNFPYPYEADWQLVTGNGSLTPICSLSKRSLSPSLTVPEIICVGFVKQLLYYLGLFATLYHGMKICEFIICQWKKNLCMF